MARSAVYRPAIYDAFRKSQEIEGSTEGAQTDYHIPIRVNYERQLYFAENGMADPLFPANYPPAVYYNGKTYIVWQGDAGYDPYIACYDHATNTWSDAVKVGTNPLAADPHGAPAILVDNSGYIHVFYGAHDTNLKYAKSDNPEDITAWTAQADPTTGCSYPMVLPDNGNIHLTYRKADLERAYRLSDDNGATWGAAQTIIETTNVDDIIYSVMMELYGTKLHMVWKYYDPPESKNVYHAYLDTADGHMYSMDGTDLGTSITEAESNANCIAIDSGEYDTHPFAMHLDGDGYPYIIVNIETDTGRDIRFTRWNGSEWVAPETITETDEALNGMDFIVHSATSITAFIVGSGAAGRGGDIVKWTWDGETWTEVKTILSEADAGMPLFSPKIVIDYDEELKLVFAEYGGIGVGDLKVYASDGDGPVPLQDSGEDVYCGGRCRTDFGDIRFRQGETELEHWLEEKVDGDYALFWVKVPNIPADPETATIHVYYGKDDATSASTESREDFTTFTEVEEIDDIQKTEHHVDFIDRRNRTTYLYKDYTLDHFNNFAEHLNVKRVTHADSASICFINMAQVVKGYRAMIVDDEECLIVSAGGTNPRIALAEYDTNGVYNLSDPQYTPNLTLGTMYYLSLRKYGTALTLDTYTTARKRLAGGAGDFERQTVTLTVDYSFQYKYVGNSYDDNTAPVGSADMENLLFRKYVEPEPANGAWGVEEAVVWPF